MDDTQRSCHLFCQAVCVLTKALGMMSENLQRIHHGESIMYPEEEFLKLIQEHAIDWNEAIIFLQGR